MKRIRDADTGVVAAALVGTFVLANVCAFIGLVGDVCGDPSPFVWGVVAAVLSGVTVLIACAKATPQAWVAITAGLATTVVNSVAMVLLVLLLRAETCTI